MEMIWLTLLFSIAISNPFIKSTDTSTWAAAAPKKNKTWYPNCEVDEYGRHTNRPIVVPQSALEGPYGTRAMMMEQDRMRAARHGGGRRRRGHARRGHGSMGMGDFNPGMGGMMYQQQGMDPRLGGRQGGFGGGPGRFAGGLGGFGGPGGGMPPGMF